ncbi:7-cyano-7-deazaguanine synthase QueC [Porphyromonadaceae bacterium W3.11]|nr:7-cyano-7-deazaguanine synthase QueC [Porphyromonadaceae bacterium W3.11]
MKKNSIIVVSGGMDSITLLHDRKDEIALAVTFDYGSNHNTREIACAKYQCELLGIKHIVIPLTFISKYFHSSLLSGAEDIPEGSYGEDNMKSTVVPFRNGIMLAIACGLAEDSGLEQVFIANHYGDHAIYPDCTEGFIQSMGQAMQHGTYNNVRIVAPYTNISKSEIAAIGKREGIDYSHTYSCYKGGENHCGKCATCIERREALADADVVDTTIYEG